MVLAAGILWGDSNSSKKIGGWRCCAPASPVIFFVGFENKRAGWYNREGGLFSKGWKRPKTIMGKGHKKGGHIRWGISHS